MYTCTCKVCLKAHTHTHYHSGPLSFQLISMNKTLVCMYMYTYPTVQVLDFLVHMQEQPPIGTTIPTLCLVANVNTEYIPSLYQIIPPPPPPPQLVWPFKSNSYRKTGATTARQTRTLHAKKRQWLHGRQCKSWISMDGQEHGGK